MNGKSTILIVDDESGPRESLKMILKPSYHVEEADGGLKAMQIIRRLKIDVVTLDLRMPGMDGLAVLKAIKDYDRHIEVVIITGHGTLENAIELVRLGACGYLTKPLKVSGVVGEISLAIEKKRTVDRLNRPFT